MKSPHSNAAELQALSAIPPAPFPLAPSAAVLKAALPLKLAALKRTGHDDEDKVLTDAAATDGPVVAEDGLAAEGAALEALAPPPLPEMSGMDMLLAQAGPAATGGGATGGGMSLGTGLAVGGAVVLIGAAASGGSSSPAPAPAPAPAGPPNQPANINASEPQRTGQVSEDADGDYETSVTGNTAASALKITDADGGADLTFRAATAGELQGKYGDFTFDAATGIWSYTLDDSDPDTQALTGGDGKRRKDGDDFDAYDYLTVWSKDGTASTLIEVGIHGHTDGPAVTEVTVGDGDMVLIDLKPVDMPNADYYDTNTPDEGELWEYEDGGFVLYFANDGFDGDYDDSFHYYVQSYSFDEGTTWGDFDITVHVVETTDSTDNNTPYFDGEFAFELAEDEASAVSFLGNLYDYDDENEPGGIFTLVMDMSNVYEDGHFVLDSVSGVRVLGNGSTEVAIQGTLEALNDYIDDGHLKVLLDTDAAGYDVYFEAYLFDEQGNYDSIDSDSDGDFDMFFDAVNDAPMIGVFMGDGEFMNEDMVASPVLYLPATGQDGADGEFDLGDSPLSVELWDEDDSYWDGEAVLDVSVAGGTHSGLLWLDYSALSDGDVEVFVLDIDGDGMWISSDSDGDYEQYYQGVATLHLRGTPGDLDNALDNDVHYTAPAAFAVGASDTLTLTFTDSDETAVTQSIALVASLQNQAPFFSLSAGHPFQDFAIVGVPTEGTDGDFAFRESMATATLDEDQHITFKGLAVNDPDALGSDEVFVGLEAYQFYMLGEDEQYGGDIGRFYIDDAYQHLVEFDGNGGQIGLFGSVDEINAMLAAGGLHYAPPPDYDAAITTDDYHLRFEIYTNDMGHRGYGEAEATLFIDVAMKGVDDTMLVLGEAEAERTFNEDGVWLYENNFLDSDYVFDAESNGNGSGGELEITAVTVASGTGTVMEDDDGAWVYTPGSGDEAGDTIEFSYTFSDGTVSMSNTLNLLLLDNVPT